MSKHTVSAILIALLAPMTAVAYEGFGAVTGGAEDAPGGYETYHVTSLANSGSGTLRDAVSQGARYIVFDVAGTITLTGSLYINDSYITIDGSSAPSPGITIVQTGTVGTVIEGASDIIIHHLRMDGQGTTNENAGDIWGLDGGDTPVSNVVIDHVTALASTDGVFDLYREVSDVTLSWNLILDTSAAMLVKYGRKDRISIHHNVFAGNNERQPQLAHEIYQMDYVNNVVYGWGWTGYGYGLRIADFGGPDDYPTLNVENNVYHYVSGHSVETSAIQRYKDGKIYFGGNIFPAAETDDYSTSTQHVIPAYAEVTKYAATTLGDTVVPFAGTHYPTQEEQDLLAEIGTAIGGQGNHAPELTLIGDRSVEEGSELSFTVSATDADGDDLSYSAADLPTGATFSNQEFSWTPTSDQTGSHTVTFTVSDGTLEDSETITITVSAVSTNQAPVLASIGDRSVAEGGSLSFTISATDVDGDAITYSATGLPTGASFSSQSFSWTPGYDQAGTHEVTFTASDGEAQDSETITITVANMNRAPVLASISDQAVNEADVLSFGISATDADGESLTYSATGLPTGATFAGQTFTWTPTYDQAGSYTVTFTASDGEDDDSEAVGIVVSNVNRAPELDEIANQAAAHSTLLTFDISGTDPDGDDLSYTASGLPSGATFSGTTFSWTPSLSQAGTYTVTFTVSDGHLTDSQAVTVAVSDTQAPVVSDMAPDADAIQAPVNGLITLHIVDVGIGVDGDSVSITLDGATIYTGDTSAYTSAGGHCYRSGGPADYTYTYQANEAFDFDEAITVTVNAADLGGIEMTPYSYSFTTEMRAFGINQCVSWAPEDVDKGSAATVCDSEGTIWVVYHAGPAGQRDIYVSSMGVGDEAFATPTQLTSDSSDQSDPDIGIGADDKLYVVWQDDRAGNWDVYGTALDDGGIWLTETRLSDPNNNQRAPAIAVNAGSPDDVYVVWQGDDAGNEDVYLASSSEDFATIDIRQLTSDTSDQTAPALAVDASGVRYVVWTDDRNWVESGEDIYGASSAHGPWTNVALITGGGDQNAAALATEASGSVLHLVWVDDTGEDSNIWYASSDPMPAVPEDAVDIVNDTSEAPQLSPAIAVTGSTGDDLKVFVCWQDWRNVSSGEDTDLYFVQVKTGDDTNVLVGDGATGSDQSGPAMGVDLLGEPYVVWTDGRDGTDEIYYAGSSFLNPTVLDSEPITASEGGTVGTASPSAAGDICVEIPAGACAHDVTISISEVDNPQWVSSSSSSILVYDFGPSGMEFDPAVVVTIAYAVADFPDEAPTPYWYDSQTGSLSQEGISHIETVELSATVHAVQFETTHFTPYYLVEAASSGGGGGGGGGGCALSYSEDTDIVDYFLPYGVMVLSIFLYRWRRRRCLGG